MVFLALPDELSFHSRSDDAAATRRHIIQDLRSAKRKIENYEKLIRALESL